MNRFLRGTRGWLVLAALAASAADAQAQNAVITGRVTSEAGQPLQGANVFITEMNISVGTTEGGQYTINIPAARVSNQQVQLRVRSVGFTPQARAITVSAGTQTVNFTLRADVTRLSEVVVTGVSTATEQIKVPFAVTRVDTTLMPVQGTNPITQLQGKVPGANIISGSGRPGSSPSVVLRGPNSINATNRGQGPVFIVDGVVLQGALPDLNPNDIENVEIVKGAAAASLYGSRGGAGVINITTKSGRTGAEGIRFGLRAEYGRSDIPREFSIARNHQLPMDPTGMMYCANVSSGGSPCARFIDMPAEVRRINEVSTPQAIAAQPFLYDAGIGAIRANRELAGLYLANTWPVEYSQVGQATTASPFTTLHGDLRGRVNQTGFYGSLSHTAQEGAFRFLGGFGRTTARLNVDQRIGDQVTVQMNTFYSQANEDAQSDTQSETPFFRLSRQPAFVQQNLRDSQGRLYIRSNPLDQGIQNFNPLYWFENDRYGARNTRFLGSGQLRYTPLSWLEFLGDLAYDRGTGAAFNQWDKGFRHTVLSNALHNGGRSEVSGDSRSISSGLGATLRPQLNIPDLNTTVSLRYVYDQQDNFSMSGSGANLAVPGLNTLGATVDNRVVGSGRQSFRSMSYFGGVDLDYLDRYILNLSLRQEGSSMFGSQERWQTFPRAAVAWVASAEPWWPAQEALGLFKLRGSIGQAGNRPQWSAQYETYTIGTGGTLNPATLGNTLLKPELVTEMEVGIDAELLGRYGLTLTYAHSTADDQILLVPAPSASGFLNQWRNAGELENKTWEAALDVPLINRPDLQWSTRLIYDRNRSIITRLDVPEYTMPGGPQGAESMYFVRQGERLGTIYGRSFVTSCSQLPAAFQSQCGGAGSQFQRNDMGFIVWTGGQPVGAGHTNNLWQAQLPAANAPWAHRLNWGNPIVIRNDETNAPVVDAIGNAAPDYHLGLSSNVSYRGFTLYGLLDGIFGRDVWNEGYQWALGDFMSGGVDQAGKSVETAKPLGYFWRVGPGIGGHPAGVGGLYDILGPTNHTVEDASFVRLREVSLSYNLGALQGQGNWTIGLVGRNLVTWTDYRGYDPEVGRGGGQLSAAALNGIDFFTFPNLRTLTVQISTSF